MKPAESKKESKDQEDTDRDSLEMVAQSGPDSSSGSEKLIIDLTKELNLTPKNAKRSLVVKIGSRVNKGELIAAKKTLSDRKLYLSPVNGTVFSISEKGVLTLRLLPKKKKVPFPDHEGKTHLIEGDWGRGESAEGVLAFFEKETDLFNLKKDYSGKILILNDRLARGFCYKASSIGIAGIVCPGLVDENFIQELEKEILFLNGQKKDVGLPLLVFRDAGEEEIKKKWQELKKYEGKKAILDGEAHCLIIFLE